MWELALAAVIIASIAGYLCDKYLKQRQQELDHRIHINTQSTEVDTVAALEEFREKFDQRINKAFENHAILKQEIDSLRLGLGLKGKI
tara:strand:+ start:632 stop:895 length:264 start_codon:yes stop_codon:yes gene_type:complete